MIRVMMVSSFDHGKCGVKKYSKNLINSLERVGVLVLKVPTFKRYGLRSIPLLLNTIRSLAKKYDVKLVHIQHEYGMYALRKSMSISFVVPILRLLGFKVVVTLHSLIKPSVLFREYREYFKKLLKQSKIKALIYTLYIPIRFLHLITATALITNFAHRVIIHVPKTIEGTYTRYGKVRVIPHGTPVITKDSEIMYPHEILEVREKSPGKLLLVTPGFIEPSKRYDWVIKAIASMNELREKVIYVIAGSCRDVVGRKWLESVIKLNQVLKAPVYMVERYLSEAELRGLIAKADAIILPYSRAHASASGVLHDALTLHKLVIAPYHDSFEFYREAIITFDSRNPVKSIKERILKLLSKDVSIDLETRVLHIAKLTSFDNVARLHKSLYSEVLSG